MLVPQFQFTIHSTHYPSLGSDNKLINFFFHGRLQMVDQYLSPFILFLLFSFFSWRKRKKRERTITLRAQYMGHKGDTLWWTALILLKSVVWTLQIFRIKVKCCLSVCSYGLLQWSRWYTRKFVVKLLDLILIHFFLFKP